MPLSHFKPDEYDSLLADKVATVEQLLAPFSPPPPQVFESARSGYRMRAEFRVWHEGNELDYVMYRREDPRTPVPLTRFPVASERIQALMPALIERLRPEQILRRKLFQVEFLSTLSGDTLVSLIYHRRLDDEWEQAASALASELGVSIVGRSRKQKLVLGREYVVERFSVQGTDYSYRQYEQAFTQPNGELNIRMVEWACAQAEDLGGDLLELYCGNGNFTLPLSRHFDQVIATELSKLHAGVFRVAVRRIHGHLDQLVGSFADSRDHEVHGQHAELHRRPSLNEQDLEFGWHGEEFSDQGDRTMMNRLVGGRSMAHLDHRHTRAAVLNDLGLDLLERSHHSKTPSPN